jgi:histidinol-phosphate aminotransferase
VTSATPLVSAAEARLRYIPAYRPGRPGPGPASGKLSSNESPFGPAPAVRAAIADVAALVGHYPDEYQARAVLAALAGVPPSAILLTNGSDELCYLLASVFLAPGRVAVLGDPPYQIDATASLLAGATLSRVPLRGGAHDLDAMAAAARHAAVVWLPSPHNPTGTAVPPADLAAFLRQVPEDCLVVLDEAYRAFADPVYQPDIGSLLAAHPNLIVQRTLSKDWALAGLRVGYALAAPALVEVLARARPPFSVNSVALAAIEGSAQAGAWHAMTVARVREQRSRLADELGRLGVEHFPSQANFIAARLDAGLVGPPLAAVGLAVRPGADLGLPGWVRISIGWAPPMAILRAALRDLSQAGALHPRAVQGREPGTSEQPTSEGATR